MRDNTYHSDDKMYIYRDFSHVLDDKNKPLLSQPSPKDSKIDIKQEKFPVKLYEILSKKEFNDIITWMPHGRSWKVLKPDIFEQDVMPMFFEYSNYHSFNRLINAWSFRRVSSGPDKGSYYHELFLRGMPHLYEHMRRLCKKEKKMPMDTKHEPDFRKLASTRPLPELDDEEGPIHSNMSSTGPQTVEDIPSSQYCPDLSKLSAKLSSGSEVNKKVINNEPVGSTAMKLSLMERGNQWHAQHAIKQQYAGELELLVLQHRRNRFLSRALFSELFANTQPMRGGIIPEPNYVPYVGNVISTPGVSQQNLQSQLVLSAEPQVSNLLSQELGNCYAARRMRDIINGPHLHCAKSG
uniref:HSF-type DNA-binding domain-containing protein n=1 Tax=Helicotheca tamesis TaxID=374047 RepID=A0A7S2HNK6_9STRA|mmetsp:Transcript_19686/g.27028  ORF Transcript_19686/g.27028 Transcript_19686/m.27028 type:complete len:352 (+) Transcript_19686:68-1123(+)|eukprot:CAMPEP_0185728706 /NCGR_PEP_ID=MMETSP1171-20130828/4065_1 /TAXON_ID=374046 /ORGANISM="Helicotheca tamensis, Strain CCMP826" /LENGTH=351 /DNA_ID=CAMNT_0028397443 /DNA_START=68 /DNA_END=1123 /DNA_ORIENTATION=+